MYKVELLPAQRELFELPNNLQYGDKDVAIYQGGYTCKKANAEYLSPTGWKRIDTLTKDDLMAVYHPEDKSIKFEKPLEIFKWKADKWYEFNTRTLHQINCPNHKMYTIKDNKPHIQPMSEFYKEHQESKQGHRGKFVTTFIKDGISTGLTPNELRLLVAYQADGTLYNYGKEYNVRFHLCKQRKIDRLQELLKGYKYKVTIQSDGDTCIYANIPEDLIVKEFPNEWYNLSSKELKIIVDEVPYWDGSIGKHNSYYTSIKGNADFIQFAASASGYRTTIFTRTRELPSGKLNTEHRVNFNTNTMPSLYSTRNKAEIKVYNAEKGEYKYCPSTSTGLWLCREFNIITVTGNSGKTFCGSLLGITLALKYPKIIGLVGAYTFTLLRDTTLKMYIQHLDALGIKYTYNKTEGLLTLPNGSEIYFKHFDDPECFKSMTVGFIELEEASQIPRDVFLNLFGRLRQPIRPEWGDKFVYRYFAHTNPQGCKGWIYEYFKKNPKPNFRRIIAPSTENKYLADSFVKDLKEMFNDKDYAINVLGKDDDSTTNLIIKGFNESVQVKPLEINERFPIHLTCDFNVDPMCWYICQDYNDCTYILYESILENTDTVQAALHIAEVAKQYKHLQWIINGDSSGQTRTTRGSDYTLLRDTLYMQGFTKLKTELLLRNPSIEWRINCFNQRMFGRDKKHHIFIHPQCQRLIYNFENLELKEGTNKPKLPSSKQISRDNNLKYLNHPIDAVSYLVCYYHPILETTPYQEYVNNQLNVAQDVFGGKYDSRLI